MLAGADALCAINTVGPGYFSAHGHAVLSNELGGMSGKGVLPIGLKCLREMTAAVDVPVIACGGISCADDVRAYQAAGASLFGGGFCLGGHDIARDRVLLLQPLSKIWRSLPI